DATPDFDHRGDEIVVEVEARAVKGRTFGARSASNEGVGTRDLRKIVAEVFSAHERDPFRPLAVLADDFSESVREAGRRLHVIDRGLVGRLEREIGLGARGTTDAFEYLAEAPGEL